MFKKIKNSLDKVFCTLFVCFVIGSAKVPFAYADAFTGSADNITSKTKTSVETITKCIGVIAVFIAIVTGAIQIIFYKSNPEKRTNAMGSLGWVAAGAGILALASTLTGFIWNAINH